MRIIAVITALANISLLYTGSILVDKTYKPPSMKIDVSRSFVRNAICNLKTDLIGSARMAMSSNISTTPVATA